MSERFTVVPTGHPLKPGHVAYCIIDTAFDERVGTYTNQARADAKAEQLNKRDLDHNSHAGYVVGQSCPHPVDYREGLNCSLCGDTGTVQGRSAY